MVPQFINSYIHTHTHTQMRLKFNVINGSSPLHTENISYEKELV